MMKSFLLFLLPLSLLLFNACISPKPIDNLAVQQQILKNEQKMAEIEKQITNQKQEMDYEKNRAAVLERENDDLQNNLNQARNNIKETFVTLMGTFEKREEELFDCYIGNAPLNRSKIYCSPGPTLLVDFGNPVLVDNVVLCGAEIYCQSPLTIQFCLIRAARNQAKTMVVESISNEYRVNASGKQKIVFPRKQRFFAAKGSYLGIYVSSAAELAYDDKGTGQVLDFQLKKIVPYETTFSEPNSLPERNGKAISFRFFGISYMN